MSVEVKLYNSSELNSGEWRQLQDLQRIADASVLGDRTRAEIDVMVGWDDPDRYYASHLDPNCEVGRRYNANQEYRHPKVALATDGDEVVGFAYSAHNVSGTTPTERLIKRWGLVKNYLWLREIAVRPDYQRQGVAKDLGRTLLSDAIYLQPVAAYVWPDEMGFLPPLLERLGFNPTGEQQVKAFGEHRPAIRQVRMQAPTVRSVMRLLG